MTTPSIDPIPHLARLGVSWFAIHAAHHRGLDVGVQALGESFGGAGLDREDGVWRQYDYTSRRFTLTVGADRGTYTAPAKKVLAWALARFDAAALAELDRLVEQRNAALAVRCEERLFHKATYQPYTLTDAERTLIRDAWERSGAAEMAAERLTRARLAASVVDDQVGPGGQLGLWPDLVGATA